jgi:hypothetical protein
MEYKTVYKSKKSKEFKFFLSYGEANRREIIGPCDDDAFRNPLALALAFTGRTCMLIQRC